MYYTKWSSTSSSWSTQFNDTDFTEILSATGSTGPTGIEFGSTSQIAVVGFESESITQIRGTFWPGGTSSQSTQQATIYTSITQSIAGNSPEATVGYSETTAAAPIGGGTTGDTTFPFTYRPTQAATLRVTYTTIGQGTNTTVLTGTAPATREGTLTSTSFFSGLTTVRQFATGVSGLWFSNVKENPQYSGPDNEFYLRFGRTAGNSATGRRVAAAFWLQVSTGDQPFTSALAEDADVALSLPLTSDVVTGSDSLRAGIISANRKIFSVPTSIDGIYLSTGTDASFYISSSATNSDLTDIPSLLVPMFRQGPTSIMTPRIFTSVESGFNIGSSSASACWSYQSSSWILYTTLANSSTQMNGSVQIFFLGSAQTTTSAATFQLGEERITHGHLGPAIPLTVSSFNRISVTSRNSANTTKPFFMRTQRCTSGLGTVAGSITSRRGVFATAVTSHAGSTSTTVAFGFASGRIVATYSHTEMTAAMPVAATIITTRNLPQMTETSPGNDGFPDSALPHPVNVNVQKANKWHEAGQANSISVQGLPAASTAFL